MASHRSIRSNGAANDLVLSGSQEPTDRHVHTMYHGTTVANARLIIANGFQQSSTGMLGPGVYVSRNQAKAARYPLNAAATSDRVVLELRVHVGRVKRIDQDNHPMQYSWNAHGFNTAWVPPNCGMKCVPSGFEEDCVFNPRRVEVIGIARAPDTTIQTELQTLIANSPRRPWKGPAWKGSARQPPPHTHIHTSLCHVCLQWAEHLHPH